MALRRLASSLVSAARPVSLLTRNYRAAVLTEFGKPLQVQELEPKPLGADEVGLCSNLTARSGRFILYTIFNIRHRHMVIDVVLMNGSINKLQNKLQVAVKINWSTHHGSLYLSMGVSRA